MQEKSYQKEADLKEIEYIEISSFSSHESSGEEEDDFDPDELKYGLDSDSLLKPSSEEKEEILE